MRYKFRIENEALRELDDILYYISNNLKNPQAATNLYNEIKHTIETIKTTPNGFDYSRNENLAKAGVRQAPVENYCILYVVDDTQMKFTVVHIKYASSDLNNVSLPN